MKKMLKTLALMGLNIVLAVSTLAPCTISANASDYSEPLTEEILLEDSENLIEILPEDSEEFVVEEPEDSDEDFQEDSIEILSEDSEEIFLEESEETEEPEDQSTLLSQDTSICGNFEYTVTDGKATITSYSGKEADLTIPDTLDGYPVTAIGDKAFRDMNFIEVLTLPDTLTSIGDYAFQDCTKLTIPTKRLPEGLEFIGFAAFSSNYKLEELTIPNSVTTIERHAFSSVKTIIFEEGRTSIPDDACHEASMLTKVVIPSTVTSIGHSAFERCENLENIQLPQGLKEIGARAFAMCDKLNNVVIPAGITVIKSRTFYASKGIKKVTLPSSLESIEEGAFLQSGIESLILPKDVKSLGNSAFDYCTSLTYIELPEGLEEIGNRAFEDNKKLNTITIPSTVKTMGTNVFKGSCQTVIFAKGMTEIPENACIGADRLTKVVVSEGLVTIGKSAFENCHNLQEMSLPDTTTTIMDSAFKGDLNLRLNITDSLVNVENMESMGCTVVKSCGESATWELDVPHMSATVLGGGNLVSNGDNLFGVFAEAVMFLRISNGFDRVQAGCFAGISSLIGVILDDSVKVIEPEAFKGCASLLRVEFSEELENIGSNAFEGCSLLQNIIFTGDAPSLTEASLPGHKFKVYCPESKEGYDKAFKEIFPNIQWKSWNDKAPSRDIVLLVDTSENMKRYSRLVHMQYAIRLFASQMGGRLSNTRISIVDMAGTEMVPLSFTSDPLRVQAEAALLTLNNRVSFTKGLAAAGEVIATSTADSRSIVILSGGEKDNCDYDSPLIAAANAIRETGVSIYSVGVVVEYSMYNLLNLAGDSSNVYDVGDITGLAERLLSDTEPLFPATFTAEFTETVASPYEGLSYNEDADRYEIIYSGAPVTPKVLVKGRLGQLKEGTDYTIKYNNNTALSAKKPATVTITGTGNYSGTRTLKFYIIADESYEDEKLPVAITLKASEHIFNGKAQTLTYSSAETQGELTVISPDSKKVLIKDTDYTVSYRSNVNAGTAAVMVKGIGNYYGTASATFKIKADPKSAINVSVDESKPVFYSPEGSVPVLKVTCDYAGDVYTLSEGLDYKVSCTGNKKAGTGKYTVNFIGNYKGHAPVKNGTFEIKPAKFTTADAACPSKAYTRPGTYKSAPYVSIDGVLLNQKDYTVQYFDGDNEVTGKYKISLAKDEYYKTITVKVTGKGNYQGQTIYTSYNVVSKDMVLSMSGSRVIAQQRNSKGRNVAISSQQYTGSEIEPPVAVLMRISGTQARVPAYLYNVRYYNNVRKGKATVVVFGDGFNTVETCKTSFTISARKIK